MVICFDKAGKKGFFSFQGGRGGDVVGARTFTLAKLKSPSRFPWNKTTFSSPNGGA